MWYEYGPNPQQYTVGASKAAAQELDAQRLTDHALAPAAVPENYKPKVMAANEPGTEYWLP